MAIEYDAEEWKNWALHWDEVANKLSNENDKLKAENATLRHEFKMAQASMSEVRGLREALQLSQEETRHKARIIEKLENEFGELYKILAVRGDLWIIRKK
jgi:predicted RNase H-like nuclease (RuvC/YqgF family)